MELLQDRIELEHSNSTWHSYQIKPNSSSSNRWSSMRSLECMACKSRPNYTNKRSIRCKPSKECLEWICPNRCQLNRFRYRKLPRTYQPPNQDSKTICLISNLISTLRALNQHTKSDLTLWRCMCSKIKWFWIRSLLSTKKTKMSKRKTKRKDWWQNSNNYRNNKTRWKTMHLKWLRAKNLRKRWWILGFKSKLISSLPSLKQSTKTLKEL